ncbi:oligosaccharide repeat unit polymerase [Gordonia alkanivorans]|uniref:oligosaccharide repeat unit polymerase n=1 Tax=Gordonia alkanivorans TaxID=84096 RepID=UPI0012F4B756|nr:oligosaccharide repeat unit polymerase [Gordonia alkanivorans]
MAIVFWPFTLVWLCIAPLVQLKNQILPWRDVDLSEVFFGAQLLTSVAILSYIIGTYVSRTRRLEASRAEHLVGTATASLRRPRTWIPLVIGGLLVVPVIVVSGSIGARFKTRDEVGAAFQSSGISAVDGDTIELFILNRLPAAAAMVALYASIRMIKRGEVSRTSSRLCLLVSLVLVILLANPFSTSRYIAFAAIIVAFLAVFRADTARRKLALAVGAIVGILYIYPLATWFKRDSVRGRERDSFADMFLTVDFDGFQQIVNTMVHVRESGIGFGSHVLAALLFFVPRRFWEGKAEPASLEVAASRGYSFENLSMPIWSELYLDLGIVGVIIGLFAYGYFSSRLDIHYSCSPNSLMGELCVIVAGCQFGLLRGPLGAQIVFLGAAVVLGVLVFGRNPFGIDKIRERYSRVESHDSR